MNLWRSLVPLLLVASTLFFPALLPAAERGKGGEGTVRGPIETCVYLKAEGFEWKEFDGGSSLLEESGPRYGVGVYRRYTRNRLTFRPMAEVYGGTVDYEGQTQGGTPIVTDTNYLGGKVGFDVGGILPGSQAVSLEPFLGLEYDYWERDIESGGVGIGYKERWGSFSARAGLHAEGGSGTGGMRLFSEAGIHWPFANTNRVDFPFVGEVTVRPEGELGWFAEAGVKAGPVRIAFFYERVEFSKSDEAVVPIGGGAALFLWQPDSEYSAYGLTAGWLFQ